MLIDLGILTPLPQSELSTLIVPAGTIRLRGRVPQGCCKVMFDLAPKMLAGGGSGCFEEEGHHNSFKKKTNSFVQCPCRITRPLNIIEGAEKSCSKESFFILLNPLFLKLILP